MQVYSQTDIGLMRSSNQDYCLTGRLPDGAVWAVVCDGMGGANGGSTASHVAADTIAGQIRELYAIPKYHDDLEKLLDTAVAIANQRVYDMSLNVFSLRGMGTTVVCAVVRQETVHILHAGDSRAYLYTEGILRQLTKDHSVVQELVDRGEITPEQADNHPHKHIITRALGTKENLQTDYTGAVFHKNDILLMCTDGLSNCVPEDSLIEFLRTSPCSELTGRLIEKAKEMGGSDNITVAVIEG